MIDAHIHLVDFLQRGPSVAELIEAMDANGLERAVVFGLPVKKTWPSYEPLRPHYYLDDNAPCINYPLTDMLVADAMLELGPEDRDRVAPLICGFDPTDRLAIDDVERMWNRYPFWRGVGELLLRHDDLTNLTYGEPPRVNHPALDEVFAFCRDKDRPISVHQDMSSPGRPREREYLVEMTEALDRHSATTVVWCHIGADRRLDPHEYHSIVDELIHRYENLHFDLSWILLEKAIYPDDAPNPHWIKLLETHPDRFVVGSDVIGDLRALPAQVEILTRLLDALGPAARELVGHENALRLWF